MCRQHVGRRRDRRTPYGSMQVKWELACCRHGCCHGTRKREYRCSSAEAAATTRLPVLERRGGRHFQQVHLECGLWDWCWRRASAGRRRLAVNVAASRSESAGVGFCTHHTHMMNSHATRNCSATTVPTLHTIYWQSGGSLLMRAYAALVNLTGASLPVGRWWYQGVTEHTTGTWRVSVAGGQECG